MFWRRRHRGPEGSMGFRAGRWDSGQALICKMELYEEPGRGRSVHDVGQYLAQTCLPVNAHALWSP